ncbi:hypothetical protein FS749_010739 [Ceratobasidium sp. UAMH 11750]|nr:hypothetical protein FS749_010739 [Ceratobasidium sp. UAMH 11750]
MIYATRLLLKSYITPIGLRAASRVPTASFVSLPARLALARSISNSASSQIRPERTISESLEPSAEDRLEFVARSRPRKDFSQSKSLHVARVHQDATDEEFRQAFSGLKGLVNAELSEHHGGTLVLVCSLSETMRI